MFVCGEFWNEIRQVGKQVKNAKKAKGWGRGARQVSALQESGNGTQILKFKNFTRTVYSLTVSS